MSTTQRRIIIGDVHGYYDGLMKLFELINPNVEDKIYFLGDLIDRGPASNQVVEFVKKNNYYCLLGNHEQMLLESFDDQGKFCNSGGDAWLYAGGDKTLQSYENQSIKEEHIQWIRQLPTYFDLDDIWLVHAGLHPRLPLEKQTAEEFCWIRDQFHNMRKPYFTDKLIITGHTITCTFPGVMPGRLVLGKGWLDIDTGVYHPKSGWLTAYAPDIQTVYQVNIFNKKHRQLPFDQVVTRVDPSRFPLIRQRL